MRLKLNKATKSFSYTVLYNIFSMIVSGVLVFLVPNKVDVAVYGYWQLYVLFSSYLNYLSLGIPDGIYLKNAGKDIVDLDKEYVATHFWVLIIMSFLLNGLAYSALSLVFDGLNIKVYMLSLISSLITIPRSFLAYLYQATGKIKDFIIGHVVERVIYLILTLCLLYFGFRRIEALILPDIIGKLLSLIYFSKLSRIYIRPNLINVKKYYDVILDTLNVGLKILISNFSSILIVGIIRFAIEKNWGIEYFSKISLTLSLTNMILSFFAAISIVLVPILKKSNPESLLKKYNSLNVSLTFFILGLLPFYFVFKSLLLSVLPAYKDSIYYLGVLFPICLFESKMSLLNVTYFKTLRKEKEMVKVNLFTLTLSIFCTYLFTIVQPNFNMLIYTIVILLGFRCVYSELLILKSYKEKSQDIIIIELFFSVIFIMLNIFSTTVIAFLLYVFCFVIFIIIKRKKLMNSIFYIKGKVFS